MVSVFLLFINILTHRDTEIWDLPSSQSHHGGKSTLMRWGHSEQARKSSEDTQVAGYARFEKVWAGLAAVWKSLGPTYLYWFSRWIEPFWENEFSIFYSFDPSKSFNSATGPKEIINQFNWGFWLVETFKSVTYGRTDQRTSDMGRF